MLTVKKYKITFGKLIFVYSFYLKSENIFYMTDNFTENKVVDRLLF